MSRDHIDRLEAIQDEVGELHPLLLRLLPKLPGVRSVTYTHGSGEMGADFVMRSDHAALGTPEYVGVIAKIGRVAQDHSGIERQITECMIGRFTEAGKKRMRLTEIWVVVTGTVSTNAQKKIYETHRSSKVRFIDRDSLIGLIDQYTPDFWSNIAPAVGEYLAHVREQALSADRASALTLAGSAPFYVGQDVFRVEDRRYSPKLAKVQKRSSRVDIDEEVQAHRLVLIEGGMGTGKSKLLRQLALRLSDPERHHKTKLVPVVVNYRDYCDHYRADLSSVLRELYEAQIPAENRSDLTPLVLVDALDEKMQDADEQVAVLRAIDKQLASLPAVHVVVTGRHLSAIGEWVEVGGSVSRYELGMLSFNRLMEFLKQLFEAFNVKGRVVEDIKKSALFRELPRSPIAAILLARLLKDSSQDLPSHLPELYAKYIELMLGRWDIEKGLQSQKEYDVLDAVLMDLAKHLLENDLSRVSVAELREMLVSYLRARNLELDADELVRKLLDRSGLVSVDAASTLLQFRHRSFVEFMYAKLAVKSGLLPIDGRALSFYWGNTYFFKFGLLRDAERELREFLALVPRSETERWMKRIGSANYCLAAYATPYDVVKELLYRAIADSACQYVAVTTGKEKSDLSALPRMHLLWFFQALIRYYFGFAYFFNAFEEVALKIDYSSLSDTEKTYALFLVSVCAVEAGGKNPFAFLFDRRSAALPMDLSVAVKLEAEHLKGADDVLKKQERRIRRAIAGDKVLAEKVKALFEVPVSRALIAGGGSGSSGS